MKGPGIFEVIAAVLTKDSIPGYDRAQIGVYTNSSKEHPDLFYTVVEEHHPDDGGSTVPRNAGPYSQI
jgi:hypothetical protein